MAITASTQQGPPKYTGCVSPACTSALLVTQANSDSITDSLSIDTLDSITSGGGGMIQASIPIDKNIRMTNNGILKTLATVQSDNGVSDPAAGPTNQSLVTCNAYQCDVKRPNCECTTLDSFYVYKSNALGTNGWVRQITFSDGYVINLGLAVQCLKIGASGLEFAPPAAGEWVTSCQSPGRTSDITTGCIRVADVTNIELARGTVMATLPTTPWPKDKFTSSEIRGTLMLENGVYIFFIPDDGTYV